MKYEFHPAALQEYAEAVQFFAQQDRKESYSSEPNSSASQTSNGFRIAIERYMNRNSATNINQNERFSI
jgi:hypothetical protein